MTQFLRSLSLLAALLISCAMAPTARADGMAEAWIRAEGLKMGWDATEQRLIVVGRAPYSAVNPTERVERRANAADQALAKASKEAARWLQAEISSRIQQKSTMAQWSEILDPEAAKAMQRVATGGFTLDKSLESFTEVCATAQLSGFSAIQTFDSFNDRDGAVEVVAEYSPRFSAWASGQTKSDVRGEQAAVAWVADLPPEILCRTFGTRFTADPDGTLHLLAFAQAPVLGGGDLEDGACEQAQSIADGLAARALARLVESSALSGSISRTQKASGLPSKFSSARRLDDAITESTRTRLAGLSKHAPRTLDDPTSRTRVCVAITDISLNTRTAPSGTAPSSSSAGGCPSVPANMQSSVRQVQVDGQGSSLEGAIAAALRAAIERDGVKVESDALLRKQYDMEMERVDEEVRTKARSKTTQQSETRTFSTGFVHSFEVLSQSERDGRWNVSICANLLHFNPRDPRFGLPPTVAVISCLGRPGEVKVAGQPEQAGGYLRIAEGALEPLLDAPKRFIVINERMRPLLQRTRNDIAARADRGEIQEIETLKLGQSLTADYLLIIELDQAGFNGSAGPRPQDITAGQQATAKLGARLVNVASGEEVWRGQASVLLKGRDLLLLRRTPDPAVEGLSPAEIAAHRAAEQLAASLEKRLQSPLPGREPQQDAASQP